MPEPKALPLPVLLHISKLLNISLKSLTAVMELLDGGATVPFIARYRKEATGNLDEVQIREIQEKLEYFRELEERRETVLESIASQGKLTPELKAAIEAALEKNELEDLYLPYKPKRRTKASIAREKGLEPLAQFLWRPAAAARGTAPAAPGLRRAIHRCRKGRRLRRRSARRRAPYRFGMDQRERGVPQDCARHDARRGRGRQPRHRGRRGSRGKVQNVCGLPRASGENPLAPHARHPTRRRRRRAGIRNRARARKAARVPPRPGHPRPRRVRPAPRSRRRRRLRPPAEPFDPDRSPARTERPVRRGGHQGLPRESREPAAFAARRHARRARHRPRHPHRLQDRRRRRYRQIPGARRHLPVRAEERPGRLGQNAGVARRAA